MSEDFIVFGAPLIEEEEIAEVVATMRSGWLGTGPKVKQFEANFTDYKNATHTSAVNSCTAALHLSLLVAGIKPGDEVITTPLTFCATVNTIIHCGAVPVLVDINPYTLNIDETKIEAKITSKTKAIIPVHFAGRPCEMTEIMTLANRYGLKVIEDCAHAIESTYDGLPMGTIGDFGCFSFYSTKNLCTGEGGMVISKDEADAQRIKTLGLHGMDKDAWKRFGKDGFKHYDVVEAGFKYNMMDLQAAIGIHQLNKLDTFWEQRYNIWNRYLIAFESLVPKITLPPVTPKHMKHGLHLFTLLINEQICGLSRDEFLNRMTELGVGTGVHYRAIPEHPYYRENYGWALSDYPHAVQVGNSIISLPLSPKLSDAEVDRVINAVYTTLGK